MSRFEFCTVTMMKPTKTSTLRLPVWLTPDGKPVSCLEKIKVLNENLEEIRALSQDALEDAVLMGCDEAQFREVLAQLIGSLANPYRKD